MHENLEFHPEARADIKRLSEELADVSEQVLRKRITSDRASWFVLLACWYFLPLSAWAELESSDFADAERFFWTGRQL